MSSSDYITFVLIFYNYLRTLSLSKCEHLPSAQGVDREAYLQASVSTCPQLNVGVSLGNSCQSVFASPAP